MRIVLGLEYDGAGYCGWQSQSGGCGIQDSLEIALQGIAGHELRVAAAGRTDAGVHALCQVTHFDTETIRPIAAWIRGVNALLPKDVRVIWAKQVDIDFHARFSARRRSYQYLLVNRPVAPAVMAGKAGWYYRILNVDVMQAAAAYLVGEHDFSAFRASECQAKSPIKQLHRAEVKRIGDNILFDFDANAFLHHQVRNMVGALIYIGNGKYQPEYIRLLLESRDRTLSPPTFSPAGLYLTGVEYESKWGLSNTQRSLALI
jgi:tRNA pseudouridine38-40 synthase